MTFLQLIKADAAQRLITARIDETPDNVGQVFDYASSKPHFEAWSQAHHAASGGKSLGNLRAMHQLVAAGTIRAIRYDDAARAIEIEGHVADDAEWAKVEAGVYTGISPGGRKRLGVGGDMRRYEAFPMEISLVDSPCIPSARFTMVKADGAETEVALAGNPVDAFVAELMGLERPADLKSLVLAAPAALVKAVFASPAMVALASEWTLAKRDYSEDERKALAAKGEAMPDGSYPIPDKDALEDAIHAFGRAKDKDAVKAHIVKRAKALDATDLLPADWEGSTKKDETPLKKGLEDVAQFAALVQALTWLVQCMAADAQAEGDGSPLPGRAAAAVAELSQILVALATEETKEACGALAAAVRAIPAYAGAAGDEADLEAAAQIADLAPLAKAAMALAASRETVMGLNASVAALTAERDLLKARVAALEAQPVIPGPVLRAVGRSGDGPGAETASSAVPPDIEAMAPGPDKALALIRHSINRPLPPRAPARRI